MRWLAGAALLTLGLVVGLGCPPIVEGPADSGGNDGGVGADAGRVDGAGGGDAAGGVDSAAENDAGNAGQDAGGGFDVLGFDISSLDIAAYDVGIEEYDGAAEPGVICADTTCAEGENCCAGFGTACQSPDAGPCGMLTIAVPCDGDEDCDNGEECCVTGTSISDYQVICVADGTCVGQGTPVCINSAECGSGNVCCSAQMMQNLGVELGWCEVGHCGE